MQIWKMCALEYPIPMPLMLTFEMGECWTILFPMDVELMTSNKNDKL